MDEVERRQRFAAAAREERPDLGLLCLLVAAEADPGFDAAALDGAVRELDRLAAEVVRRVRGGEGTPRAWATVLREVLGTGLGFHGRSSDYGRLSSSLLHEVLHRRRGLPILLSVVWIEVGRRAGAPVYGVGLAGHFVVGIGDPAGHHVLADPFQGGRELTADEAAELAAQATGRRKPPGAHLPAEPLEIVARVLNNIRVWAAIGPEHSGTRLWAVELSLLLPRHSAGLRLDRARLLVERGDFVRGATEMESYARLVAVMDPEAAEEIRGQARAARARLN